MSGRLAALAAMTVFSLGSAVAFAQAQSAIDTGLQATAWTAGTTTRTVAEGGTAFRRDVARFTLAAGTLRSLRLGPDAAGVLFEGRGRFEMDVPHEVEKRQLRRFAKNPSLDRVDVAFTRMILLSAREVVAPPTPFPADDTAVEEPVLKARHEDWLRRATLDARAAFVRARANEGDDFLLVDMETEAFGWIMFVFDPWNAEEVQLVKLQPRNDFAEVWVSLDAEEQRRADGSPSLPLPAPFELVDVTSEIDLRKNRTGDADSSSYESFDTEPIAFRTTVTVAAQRVAGLRALPFTLHPRAEVKSVSEDGRPIGFVRDRLGARFSDLKNDVHDDEILVLLPAPLLEGAPRRLTFDYVIKSYNYVEGDSWYPVVVDSTLADTYTATLTFTMHPKCLVRAVGEQVEDKVEGDVRRSTWKVTRPAKMVSFAFGRRLKEEKVKTDGAPEIVSFGVERGTVSGNMVRNVAADLANSLRFFGVYLDAPLPLERLYATRIEAGHGQAFDGFLHLSGYTFEGEHPGASELFRAHEAAHQYWGHAVGWASYRDQWLSESLAEYSAMMFVQAALPEKKFFEEILDAYTNMLLGSQSGGFSKFYRPFFDGATANEQASIGPIGVGWRASSAMAPYGYYMQAYVKGPLVLHMLRSLFRTHYRSDENFRKLLQQYYRANNGKLATTEGLRKLIEKETGSDWRWFFDQWVDGRAIPTYSWNVSIPNAAGADGKWDVALTVKQEGVPDGFRMPVTVRVELPGNKMIQTAVLVQKPEETFHLPLPVKPSKVIFNPDFAVLARTKKM